MDIPEDFTIKCSRCNSTHTEATPLSGSEWLATCQDCFNQDVLTNEALEQARQDGFKTITGQPLISGKRAQKPNLRGNISSKSIKTQVESPLIANARKRANADETTRNPIIANARKRAAKAHTEVQDHV